MGYTYSYNWSISAMDHEPPSMLRAWWQLAGKHIGLLVRHVVTTFCEIAAAGGSFLYTRTSVPVDHAVNEAEGEP